MGSKKQSKKSVSFQKLKDEDVTVSDPVNVEVPRLKHSLLGLPFHSLILLAGMFSNGLTQRVNQTMVNGLGTSVCLHLIYNYLIGVNTKRHKAKKKEKDQENKILLAGAGVFVSLIISLPFFVFIILFGAPLATHLRETALLAAHLSLLLFSPLLVSFKLDYDAFFAMFTSNRLYNIILHHTLLSSAFFTIVGAWLGVLPIPLDWDRDWQKWPITILSGGYIGSFVGAIISLIVQYCCPNE